MTDTLEKIEKLGATLLDNIETDAKSTDLKVHTSAPRSYYSVSKVLLAIVELNEKLGKAKQKDIADALTKELKKMALGEPSAMAMRDLRSRHDMQSMHKLAKQIAQKQKALIKKQTVSAGEIKEIIMLISQLVALVLTVVAAIDKYKRSKRAKRKGSKQR